jgi:hypothetical protein
MFVPIFLGILLGAIFLAQAVVLWWRQNAWRRRWKDRDEED